MNISQRYDAYWKSGRHQGEEWNDLRLRSVLGPLLGLDRVLDYGCGMGYNYQRGLASAVKHYIAADVSEVALEDARSKGFETQKIAEDGSVHVSPGSIDGAVSVEVFEHLWDPLAAVRSIYRALKPGGVLVATVPNFGYHAWRIGALVRAQVPSEPENRAENRHNGVHIRYFSKHTFTQLFTDAGFESVEIGAFDDSSIWDVVRGLGPLSALSDFARRSFPRSLHLRWLERVIPSVFAYRLRAVARKPGSAGVEA